jgi:hypothetical protein
MCICGNAQEGKYMEMKWPKSKHYQANIKAITRDYPNTEEKYLIVYKPSLALKEDISKD